MRQHSHDYYLSIIDTNTNIIVLEASSIIDTIYLRGDALKILDFKAPQDSQYYNLRMGSKFYRVVYQGSAYHHPYSGLRHTQLSMRQFICLIWITIHCVQGNQGVLEAK